MKKISIVSDDFNHWFNRVFTGSTSKRRYAEVLKMAKRTK